MGWLNRLKVFPLRNRPFNLPALWIPADREDEAKFAGYTVVDNSTVVSTHITEIIRKNAYDLLGRQEVQHLLDNLAKANPKAVEELIPNLLTLGSVQKVLQNLLRERISVRDLLTIVEPLPITHPWAKIRIFLRNMSVRNYPKECWPLYSGGKGFTGDYSGSGAGGNSD